jgi:polysaccharide export outer membrane protein
MRNSLVFSIGCAIIFFLNSCGGLYPSTMFKQKDYQYFELAQKKIEEYNIVSGDLLSLKVYSRDGFKLLDMIIAEDNKASGSSDAKDVYLVDQEGFVKLPIIGELFVRGYTETQLKTILIDKLASIYVEPFIILKVENRRAIVITASAVSGGGGAGGGGGGAGGGGAKIVELNQSPTSIIEVLAKAGGLSANSRANKIKVIRGDLKNPQVIEVNLATIEGVRKSAMDVLPNDIIYIESKRNVARAVLADVAPFIGLGTTITSLIVLIRSFGNL